MKFVRTANAGILLELDGVRVMIDGIANCVYPYMATPDTLKETLKLSLPDILAFTHTHADHYDADYARLYEERAHRSVVGPVGVSRMQVDALKIEAVFTRHIGKAVLPHVSFVLTGTQNVWFMGDASPDALREMADYSKPDVLFVPYAFALTASAWRKTKETGAKKIILLHLPNRQDDIDGLWDAVLENTRQDSCLSIPEIGEKIEII